MSGQGQPTRGTSSEFAKDRLQMSGQLVIASLMAAEGGATSCGACRGPSVIEAGSRTPARWMREQRTGKNVSLVGSLTLCQAPHRRRWRRRRGPMAKLLSPRAGSPARSISPSKKPPPNNSASQTVRYPLYVVSRRSSTVVLCYENLFTNPSLYRS